MDGLGNGTKQKVKKKKPQKVLIIISKDREKEIGKMCGMKTTRIPVGTGALGLVSWFPANINVQEVQKIVLLITAHILRWTPSIK